MIIFYLKRNYIILLSIFILKSFILIIITIFLPAKRKMKENQKLICSLLFLIVSTFFINGCASQNHYKKIPDGIVITFDKTNNTTKALRLKVINSNIIQVTASPVDTFSTVSSLMIINEKRPDVKWNVDEKNNQVALSTSTMKAIVSLSDGTVQFTDTSGNIRLREKNEGRIFLADTIEGVPAYQIRNVFENVNNNALYGMGENQLGLVNLQGKDLLLAQHNTEAVVPFLVSNGNYGILWDNNSITHFGDPSSYLPLDSFQLYNQENSAGTLTATYKSGIENSPDLITRQEKKIDYSYLSSLKNLPDSFHLASSSSIEWNGFFSSPYSGIHKFLIRSGGYIKLWIDGKLLVDKWRQSWNSAETLVEFSMEKNKKYSLKLIWLPDGAESFLSMKWRKPLENSRKNDISFSSEMAQDINYYYINGKNIDSVISGYRTLTGKAPIMPVWSLGFWQSRERYNSQKEILGIVKEFRRRHIPLDNIVQDWFYWKKDEWGNQEFDSSRYPDPSGMIDSLHNQYHTHFMISVWPKFYEGIRSFKEFWDKGWLYKKNVEDQQKDWVGYVSTFYDAFNPNARKAFWKLVNKKIFRVGVDAWWLDATEPDIMDNISLSDKKKLMEPNYLGPAARNFNAYSLQNSEAFYNGQRSVNPDQRVFILTRSAFAGNQRYAAATWSGDIGATWQDMKNQIATGINFSMSGIPYWTMDIGGFAVENRYQHPDEANLAEWREQMTRWFQFGAFCPLFRSHGQFPYREIFNVSPENSPAYQSMLYYDKLRYRLLPYIYSLAGATYFNNYTIMRGLVMDFPTDSIAANVTDEFMFGPDLLINPVYTYKLNTRSVYLPAGVSWFDLYNGKYFEGGQTINADAPYTRMPVFVKSGSIIPIGPEIEYTQQKSADTLTLYVYTGKDGLFNLYEDEGTNYNYEKGSYSIIPFSYNEKDKSLTIGKREGSFKGMLKNRIFNIKWISKEYPEALDFNKTSIVTVNYDGSEKMARMK